MALTNPQAQDSQLADANNNPLVGAQQATIVELTDTTTGTAGDTVDDTTVSVKDDIATLAAKINSILQVLAAHGLIADA
jgi:hypothetical protein